MSPLASRPALSVDDQLYYDAYRDIACERFNGFGEVFIPVTTIDVMARRRGLSFDDLLIRCRAIDAWRFEQAAAERAAKEKGAGS